MLARIKAGWRLTGKSWQTLRGNKTLLLFPVVSSLASIVALLLLLIPAGGLAVIFGGDIFNNNLVFYFSFFVFLLVSTLIAVFFNVALVSQVAASFRGEEVSFKGGVGLAWSRKGVVLQWSVIVAFVGTLLRIAQDKLPLLGKVLAILGGLAWGVAAWFVVPVLALENKGPVDSLKYSVATVKKRWGEGVTGMVAIGGIFAILGFTLIIAAILGVVLLATVSPMLAVLWGFLLIAVLVAMAFVSTALRQIFDTAVYLSITTEAESMGLFTREDIESAVIKKKNKRSARESI
jgi:hypothetical protein